MPLMWVGLTLLHATGFVKNSVDSLCHDEDIEQYLLANEVKLHPCKDFLNSQQYLAVCKDFIHDLPPIVEVCGRIS